VSFSTFWHAKGGLQMCVFLGRAMNFFWPQSRGGGWSPPRPPWIRRWFDVIERTLADLGYADVTFTSPLQSLLSLIDLIDSSITV